jgi:uncharacterized membrane protein
MTVTHPLAIAWLERVERLASDLLPDARSELLADLREHLDAALATAPDTAAVASVLDRLGDPVDVVDAARSDTNVRDVPDVPDGLTGPEVGALAVLVLAGLSGIFVWPLTILLWAIGIAIVAVSGRWRGGEILSMILLPIGWALPVLSMIVPVSSSMGRCEVDSTGVETCTMQQSGFVGGPWVLVVLVAGLVLLVLGTRWLAHAPRGRPRRS